MTGNSLKKPQSHRNFLNVSICFYFLFKFCRHFNARAAHTRMWIVAFFAQIWRLSFRPRPYRQKFLLSADKAFTQRSLNSPSQPHAFCWLSCGDLW